MCLQYAVWTMGTLANEKYSHYHGAFHRRCRHYLEEDELKVCKDWHDSFYFAFTFFVFETLRPVLPLTVVNIGGRRTLPHCSPCPSLGTNGNY